MFHPGRVVPLMSGSYVRPLGSGRTRRRIACTTVLATLSAVISGCAVGPNFHPAPAPDVAGYVPGKLASPDPGPGGPRVAGQHFVTGAEVSARWWSAFRSLPLNDLVKQSVDRNPNLQAAEAAIRVAQYNAQAQRGLFYPQVTGNSTSSKQLFSNAGTVFGDLGSVPQTQYTLATNQLAVSFVPDIWGANSRAVENLDAVTEQQLFQLHRAQSSRYPQAAVQFRPGGASRCSRAGRGSRPGGTIASAAAKAIGSAARSADSTCRAIVGR
jgi:outer membrane protein TolC